MKDNTKFFSFTANIVSPDKNVSSTSVCTFGTQSDQTFAKALRYWIAQELAEISSTDILQIALGMYAWF